MPVSDMQFRWSVIAGGVAVALGLASVRFCGSVALPAKVVTAQSLSNSATQLMTETSGTASVFTDFIARDARAAGVPAPTLDQLRAPFEGTAFTGRQVLEVGGPAMQAGGLTLTAVRAGDTLALEIHNPTDQDLAYLVETTPTPASSACNGASPLPFNAMVVGKRSKELRVECSFRAGMVIAVTRVETLAVPPLSAFYLSQVPPALVGIEPRIARGHRAPETKEKCSSLMGEAQRNALENGEIRWRDLVDYFARHRCQTYQFPMSYRALSAGDTRSLPVVR